MMNLKIGLVVFAVCGLACAQTAPSVSAAVVANANSFLSSLDDGQRSRVLFDFNDAGQRVRWSNLPTTMVARAGFHQFLWMVIWPMVPQMRASPLPCRSKPQ